MEFTIKEVKDKKGKLEFLEFPKVLYKDDSSWVSPLDAEISAIFQPEKNTFFSHGIAIRWCLYSNDKVVGRIAAFINYEKMNMFEQPTGGIGFFECIENYEAAVILFNTAKEWLMKQEMEAMDGPINFGENDKYWGLLVDGFSQPFYGMWYHKAYYKSYFEKYGFNCYFKQYSKVLDITKQLPERFEKIATWIANKNDVRVEYARKKLIPKLIEDFVYIYNDAWQHHPNFVPLTVESVRKAMSDLQLVIIEEMCIFSYVNNEPAGFIICLPDLNQIFKPFKGKLGVWDGLMFLWRKRNNYEWYRKRKILTQGRVMIMGVRPKFQKQGVESMMIVDLFKQIKRMGFEKIELGWVGDFNPSMQAIVSALGADGKKTYHTYRYLFNSKGDPQYSKMIK